MKYKVVILDLDNTLIDFDQMEVGSLKESFETLQIAYTDAMIEDYILINKSYWEALEQGKYTKAEILIKRFESLFQRYHLEVSAQEMNRLYLANMKHHVVTNDGAYDILNHIKDRTKVVCLTNGVQSAQEAKFEQAGFQPYFDHVIISDVVGIHKPDPGIFHYMMGEIGPFEKEEMIIVGDSLTSDIKGGVNFGIATVWYNPEHRENTLDLPIDFEIQSLHELKSILG